MKLSIETVYENFDQEWLNWYLNRLSQSEELPGSDTITQELKETGHAVFASKDPESKCFATTTYRIEK